MPMIVRLDALTRKSHGSMTTTMVEGPDAPLSQRAIQRASSKQTLDFGAASWYIRTTNALMIIKSTPSPSPILDAKIFYQAEGAGKFSALEGSRRTVERWRAGWKGGREEEKNSYEMMGKQKYSHFLK